VFNEPELLVPGKMANIRGVACDEIVDGDHPMTFCQKPVHEMRAQKASASGYDRNGLRIFGH
jgi:hypothetical protein